MPLSFAESGDGLLLMADGMGAVRRWDGATASVENAGMAAPTSAPTLAGTGSGTLSGTYRAYLRYVDNRGNVSNLSDVSSEVTVTNIATFTFSGLAIPPDQKVKRRQVLRNTDGQTLTFYIDIDTTDLTSTSLTSTKTDTQLVANDAEGGTPLLNADGTSFANRHGVPPDWKQVLANHNGRMFMAVDGEYTAGMAQVTFGSTTVTGVGTVWTSIMVGRFLHVVGADKRYEISAVDQSAQTLTLASTYLGSTDSYAAYTIRPADDERRLVYYSETGLPESWQPESAFAIPETGDNFTGLMQLGSFLFVMESRQIWRFTFYSDPALDGKPFQSSKRGCVNNRCWVVVDDNALMLDYQGVHLFDGGSSQSVSDDIFGIFAGADGAYGINWNAQRWFHAVHSASQATVRWFVAMSGEYLPRHAICYAYREQRWWIEEYAFPIGSSCIGTLQGQARALLGASQERVFANEEGPLDGADAFAGTVRGTVTSATLTSITDTSAYYASSRLVGSPIVIAYGKGRGQKRIISAVSGTTISVTQPWLIKPDTTSVYQLGGIQWQWRTGWMRFLADEQLNPRRAEVVFVPTKDACQLAARRYLDFADDPEIYLRDMTANEGGLDVTAVKNSEYLDIRATKTAIINGKTYSRPGVVMIVQDDAKEMYIDGPRYQSLELLGVPNTERQRIRQITVMGVEG